MKWYKLSNKLPKIDKLILLAQPNAIEIYQLKNVGKVLRDRTRENEIAFYNQNFTNAYSIDRVPYFNECFWTYLPKNPSKYPEPTKEELQKRSVDSQTINELWKEAYKDYDWDKLK